MTIRSHRARFPSASQALALEPRLLFDGAGAVAAVEHIDAGEQPDAARPQDAVASIAAPAAEAARPDARLVGPMLLPAGGDHAALLADAAAQAAAHLDAWSRGSGFLDEAAQIFSATAGSEAWTANAEALRLALQDGSYAVRVEVRSGAEMPGLLGAWSATGTAGQPVIYLNADYLTRASADQLQQVLLEEIGHDIDHRLNGAQDSPGDEGHAFAALLLTGNANLGANRDSADHLVLALDGRAVPVEAAGGLDIAQVHFVPLPEADIQSALKSIGGVGRVSGDIQTVIAISASADNTVVVYDEWEDGYEADLGNPVQASTKVWTYTSADGWFVDTNGNGVRDMGESAVANGTTIVASGQTLILKNAVDPANPAAIDFDGGDKIGSSKAIAVTRAGWSLIPGTLLAGAVNLFDAANAGKTYTLPIGQNLNIVQYYKNGDSGVASGPPGPVGGTGLFEYTSAHIMATENGTTVWIDKDGDGSIDVTVSLDQGQSYFVNGGLRVGGKITADKGVGVSVIAGDVGSNFDNRWFTLTPDEQWSSSYYAPVSTTLAADPSAVLLFNPNAAAITVYYDTASGTGSVTVNARGYAGFLMPASAAHFYTKPAGGDPAPRFFAVGVIDADATSHTAHDWSYSLIPESYLTDRAVAAWAPGADNVTRALAPSDLNGSPIWLTPTRNTTLYIDSTTVTVMDGAGNAVAGVLDGASTKFVLSRLQSYRIFDSDKDQSGLVMYTRDGTLISAAWGEDPSIAGPGAPYLDMGTTITPHPDYVLSKSSAEAATAIYGLAASNDNGQIELGEEVVYTVRLTNRAVIDLFNINFTDAITPADGASYVAGSTVISVYHPDGTLSWTAPLADNPGFPLAGGGYTITDIDPGTAEIDGLKRGGVIEISYRLKVRNDINIALAVDGYAIGNSVRMRADGGLDKTREHETPLAVTVTDGEIFLMKGDYSEAAPSLMVNDTIGLQVIDGDQNRNPGMIETLTVLVTNVTTGEKETVTLTETGANTGIFRGTLPTSNAVAQVDDDGTLKVAVGNAIKAEYVDPVTGQNGSAATGFDNPLNPGISGDFQTGNSNVKTSTVVAGPPPGPTDGLVEFWDAGFASNRPNFQEGQSLGIQVTDGDQNRDPGAIETLTVIVTNVTTGEKETVLLTETGANTGIFRGTLATATAMAAQPDNNGTLKMVFGDTVKVEYTDPVTGATSDSPDNPLVNQNRDTATAVKIKTLYLSDDAADGDRSGGLDRIDPRDPVDASTAITGAIEPILASATGTASATNDNTATLTFNHDPGAAGSDKLLLVYVAVGNTAATGIPPTVTGVTFGGTAMTLVDSLTSPGFEGVASGDANVRVYLYRLANPGNAADQVEVSLSGNGSIVAGAVTFKDVDQVQPIPGLYKAQGNPALHDSLNIAASNANELIFGIGAWDETGTVTADPGQTELVSARAAFVQATISTQPGGGALSHGYTSTDNQDHVLMAVKLRSANSAHFTQDIALTDALQLPAAGVIKVVTHVSDEAGLVAGTQAINARLSYGFTTLLDLGNAEYDPAAHTLTWTAERPTNATIPAGSLIRLSVTNNEAGSSFKIDYDSSTSPSRIELPVTTVIGFADVDADAGNGVQLIGIFNRPYADAGNLIADATANAGQTVYLRVRVSDPFGDYDISGLTLSIDGPGNDGDIGPITLGNPAVVDGGGDGFKIYEYAWHTINHTGSYTVTAIAHEGSEGIQARVSGEFFVAAVDHGTPSVTEFIRPDGSDPGAAYNPGEDAWLRVTDLDEAGKGTVTAKVNGITVTLAETGPGTGIFEADLSLQNPLFDNLPPGTVLNASYKDVDDPADTSSDMIAVPVPGNNPPVATDNARSINENQTAAGGNLISSNEGSGVDSDPDGDPLGVIAINGDSGAVGATIILPSGARLTVAANGSYTYDPNHAFDHLTGGQQATDSFTYTISDGNGGTSTATVTITINGVGDPSITVTDHNGAGTVGDNSIAENAGAPVAGTFFVSAPYGLKEISVGGTTVTAAQLAGLGVTPVTIVTAEGQITLTGYNGATGEVGYSYRQSGTHKDHATGDTSVVDRIPLTVTDLANTVSPSRLDILITDTAPAAANDANSVTEGATLTVAAGAGVLANDTPSADGWSPSGPVVGVKAGLGGTPVTGVGAEIVGAYGKLRLNADGSYTYAANAGIDHSGGPIQDVFTYTVRDADGDATTATLTIIVGDDVPVAANDTGSVRAGDTLTVAPAGGVLVNDASGADGWTAGGAVVGIAHGMVPGVVGVALAGDHGTLTLRADGSYVYVADPALPPPGPGSVTDTFTYTVRDGDGDETTATLTITVINNQPPVANDDTRSGGADVPLSGNVIGGGGPGDTPDSDPDGDPLRVTQIVVDGVVHPVAPGAPAVVDLPQGQLVFESDGSYTFTPAPGWSGTLPPVTYTVDDGSGYANSSATATLTITVLAENRPPAAPFAPDLLPPLPPNPLGDSPVTLEAGPYFAGERFNEVRLMPLPFHPIVYVNREVEASHAERERNDPRGQGRDPQAAADGYREPRSLAVGLGFDPTLYVTPAVRESQSLADFYERTVDGRWGRVWLGSDNYVGGRSLFDELELNLPYVYDLGRRDDGGTAGAPAERSHADGAAAERLATATPRDVQAAMQSVARQPPAAAPELVAAPSFAQQLRSGASRLPLAAPRPS